MRYPCYRDRCRVGDPALTEWQPHLAILDMDLEGGQAMEQIGGHLRAADFP